MRRYDEDDDIFSCRSFHRSLEKKGNNGRKHYKLDFCYCHAQRLSFSWKSFTALEILLAKLFNTQFMKVVDTIMFIVVAGPKNIFMGSRVDR